MSKTRLPVILLFVFTGGVFGASSAQGAPRAGGDMITPTRGTIVRDIACSGVIRSAIKASVRAETGGKVESIAVAPGADVEAGQVILKLSNPQLQRARRELDQQLKIAELKLAKAQAKIKAPGKDDDAEQLALDARITEAELAIVRLKVESNAEAIEKLTARALRKGRVVSVDVAEGDLVTGAHEFSIGSQLYQIMSTSEFMVDVNLGERDVSLLTKNAPVKLKLPGLHDLVLEGKISQISEAARQGERAAIFPVAIAFESNNPMIKIGLSAQATIEIERQAHALIVPIDCVRFAQDGAYIMEKVDGEPRRKSIKTGIITEELVEVKEGVGEHASLVRFVKI